MGLDDIFRDGVALMNTTLADLQGDITIAPWTGHDFNVKPTYAAAVTYPAIINRTQRVLRGKDGQTFNISASVQLLQPVTATVATGRQNPIDPRDKVTLPNGDSWPILRIGGVDDPSTSAPYAAEIFLG